MREQIWRPEPNAQFRREGNEQNKSALTSASGGIKFEAMPRCCRRRFAARLERLVHVPRLAGGGDQPVAILGQQ
jgi:hypothetical protein